jgi:hypothetical protein
METKTGIPIDPDTTDPYYRYRRSPLNIKTNKKKGVQTILLNIEEIANQLRVPTTAIMKYISKKIGCGIKDVTINKDLSVEDIETVINNFIRKYVLCKKCRLPELKASKTAVKCSACGFVEK